MKLQAVDVKLYHCDQMRHALDKLARTVDWEEIDSASAVLRALESADEVMQQARHVLLKRQSFLQEVEQALLREASQMTTGVGGMGGAVGGAARDATSAHHARRDKNRVMSFSLPRAMMLRDRSGAAEEVTDYLESMLRLFQATRVLEQWQLHCRQPPAWLSAVDAAKVSDRLAGMGMVLRLVCAMAVHDLGTLHSQSLRRIRDWMLAD